MQHDDARVAVDDHRKLFTNDPQSPTFRPKGVYRSALPLTDEFSSPLVSIPAYPEESVHHDRKETSADPYGTADKLSVIRDRHGIPVEPVNHEGASPSSLVQKVLGGLVNCTLNH